MTTAWFRVEPSTRTDDGSSLSARLADPLWLLGRQWQFGEFDGHDAGTPIGVVAAVHRTPLTSWAPQGGGQPRAIGHAPLDSQVSAVQLPPTVKDRVLAGHIFVKALGRKYADVRVELANQHSDVFMSDADHRLDGQKLTGLTGPYQKGADAVASWLDRRFGHSVSAWKSATLTAPFEMPLEDRSPVPSVARGRLARTVDRALRVLRTRDRRAVNHGTEGTVGLDAPDSPGGPLSWHDFDLHSQPANRPSKNQADLRPTRITFPGQPTDRFWQFEDRRLDLSAANLSPEDIGLLVLTHLIDHYDGDYYSVPISAAGGELVALERLTVTTNFGDQLQVDRSGNQYFHPTWEADAAKPAAYLVLPPSSMATIRGSVVEEVLLAQDEMANLVWATARRIRAADGRSLDPRTAGPDPHGRTHISTTQTGTYVLQTQVPSGWTAFDEDAGDRLRPVVQGQVDAGAFLGAFPPEGMPARVVPRTGRTLQLRALRARGTDGRPYQWWAWEVSPGRGEGSAGLRHDTISHERKEAPQ